MGGWDTLVPRLSMIVMSRLATMGAKRMWLLAQGSLGHLTLAQACCGMSTWYLLLTQTTPALGSKPNNLKLYLHFSITLAQASHSSHHSSVTEQSSDMLPTVQSLIGPAGSSSKSSIRHRMPRGSYRAGCESDQKDQQVTQTSREARISITTTKREH